MDGKTAEIRYGQWVQVIQDWSNNGLTKRDYCQEKGIDEKQFYYYQRRIRSLIAVQVERQALPDENSNVIPDSAVTDRRASRPQIVRLQLPGMESGNSSMIRFSVNGMNLRLSSLRSSRRRQAMVLAEINVEFILSAAIPTYANQSQDYRPSSFSSLKCVWMNIVCFSFVGNERTA